MKTASRHRETPNRLAQETSPYLLQHAHNPVDWYPWGEEAISIAKKEQKPIFLSIGYSACHWCHVMEKESFKDQETADLLKRSFVAIKVDREERPDLDSIYMNAVQMITGRGGWPLSVFLTPELKPFYGGTYFPPTDMYGMPGFKNVLTKVAAVWEERRDEVQTSADELTEALKAIGTNSDNPEQARTDITARAINQLKSNFDRKWGGFGSAPKFPPVMALSLLMRHHAKTGSSGILDMVTKTLDGMACGGMYDQIGGGFHRYSVDERWLVPHFEKMLYDNAMLASLYLQAYQLTAIPQYRQTALKTLDYVIRDMVDKQGGIYSSQDADSEGEEGRYYIWTPAEIKEILGEKEASLACRCFNITPGGNFEGRNIPHTPAPPAEFASQANIPIEVLENNIGTWRNKLLSARSTRTPPLKDTKIIASWNGMMISALANGYKVLGEARFIKAAENAAGFMLSSMMNGHELARSYAGGKKGPPAYLEDYAETALGLIDLYEATFNLKWLDSAENMTRTMLELFTDPDSPGFFFTSSQHSHLLVRTKEFSDSSTPSGNSVASHALLRLGRLTGNANYISLAKETATAAINDAERAPTGFMSAILAAESAISPSREIVIVGPESSELATQMLSLIRRLYLPETIVLFCDPAARNHSAMIKRLPLLKDRHMIKGTTTAYVCQDYSCLPPVTSTADLIAILMPPKDN